MNKLLNSLANAVLILALIPSLALAAEMDHSKMDHSKMGHGMNGPKVAQPTAGKKSPLKKLSALPASGSSREAGSDGRYAMEPTSTRTRLSEQCAQATRGLIMLDNATWKRCGGKPKGASMGAGSLDHTRMDHSKMKH